MNHTKELLRSLWVLKCTNGKPATLDNFKPPVPHARIKPQTLKALKLNPPSNLTTILKHDRCRRRRGSSGEEGILT